MGEILSFTDAHKRRLKVAEEASRATITSTEVTPRHPGIDLHAVNTARTVERHSRLIKASMNFGNGCSPEDLEQLDDLERRIAEVEFHLPAEALMNSLRGREI